MVAWHAFENGYRFSTALNLPKFPVLVIIPIGAAWLGLAFVVRILTGSRAQAATTAEKGGL